MVVLTGIVTNLSRHSLICMVWNSTCKSKYTMIRAGEIFLK